MCSLSWFWGLLPLVRFPLERLPHQLIVLFSELPDALLFLCWWGLLAIHVLFDPLGRTILCKRFFLGLWFLRRSYHILIAFGGLLDSNPFWLGRRLLVILQCHSIRVNILARLRRNRGILHAHRLLLLLVKILLLRRIWVLRWYLSVVLHSVQVAWPLALLGAMNRDYVLFKHARLRTQLMRLVDFVNIERDPILISLVLESTLHPVNLDWLILLCGCVQLLISFIASWGGVWGYPEGLPSDFVWDYVFDVCFWLELLIRSFRILRHFVIVVFPAFLHLVWFVWVLGHFWCAFVTVN